MGTVVYYQNLKNTLSVLLKTCTVPFPQLYQFLMETNDLYVQIRSFERRICTQTQDLQIFKKFNMSQTKNPKEVFHNTAYSVQLSYIAGHSL